jgi:hypothetical protein
MSFPADQIEQQLSNIVIILSLLVLWSTYNFTTLSFTLFVTVMIAAIKDIKKITSTFDFWLCVCVEKKQLKVGWWWRPEEAAYLLNSFCHQFNLH